MKRTTVPVLLIARSELFSVFANKLLHSLFRTPVCKFYTQKSTTDFWETFGKTLKESKTERRLGANSLSQFFGKSLRKTVREVHGWWLRGVVEKDCDLCFGKAAKRAHGVRWHHDSAL